jgi:hypothetical protein
VSVRAARAYHVVVTREGRVPALFAGDRIDHVEVIETDGGEVVLYWDLPARKATKLAGALREDLGRLGADEFLAAWQAAQD